MCRQKTRLLGRTEWAADRSDNNPNQKRGGKRDSQ